MRVERAYRLRGTPHFGETIQAEGRRYKLVGIESYTNKRGARTQLYKFEGRCRECGEPFVFMTSRKAFWPTVHCQNHRPGARKRGQR